MAKFAGDQYLAIMDKLGSREHREELMLLQKNEIELVSLNKLGDDENDTSVRRRRRVRSIILGLSEARRKGSSISSSPASDASTVLITGSCKR